MNNGLAIITKFLPATNTKPSRIKATIGKTSITVNWLLTLDAVENHINAMQQLCAKIDRNSCNYKMAWLPGGDAVFV